MDMQVLMNKLNETLYSKYLDEVKDFLLAYLKSGGIAMMKTFLSM
jgi:hypothetical protein